MNYEKDIEIDETALDLEWLEQPSLMIKYAKHLAETNRLMDSVKEKRDIVRAELDLDIRKNPDDYNIDKITEAVVQSVILLQDKYKEINKKYFDACFEYEMSKLAVRAIEHRKEALENLVKLHGQQYFAGPRMPLDISREKRNREENRQESNKAVKIMRRGK